MSEDVHNYSEEEFTEATLHEMQRMGQKYAKAKGENKALEQQRKALRSILMKEAELRGVTSIQKQQRDAESDPRYWQVCEAVGIAQRTETQAWIEYEILKIRFEKWRTERADYRAAVNMR